MKIVRTILVFKSSKSGKSAGLGVDVLRWWVAAHASSSSSVLVGDAILTATASEVASIRRTLRYLLGLLHNMSPDKVVEYSQLELIDKLALHRLYTHLENTKDMYQNMEYSKICLATHGFLSSISKTYLHLIKDR